MCSHFVRSMGENNYHQGDLNDIIRASGGVMGAAAVGQELSDTSSWKQYPPPSDPMMSFYSSGIEEPSDDFGDPFFNMRDPLLYELDIQGSVFFNSSVTTNTTTTTTSGGCGGSGGGFGQKISGDDDDEMKNNNNNNNKPCSNNNNNNNLFSRMLQISQNASSSSSSPSPIDSMMMKAAASASTEVISAINTSSKDCLVQTTGLQISSPRNSGIKRRKSQAKKVVCIPAPAPASSRPSGEVVPSDLWAWRKYGQKPIKGSPHPRGYYRCSSSKGCSARKQVERSRTDPNMLVITYTSEHNHPWPTQRNALAGSTRSQPPKNGNSGGGSKNCESQKGTNFKEEPVKDKNTDNNNNIVAVGNHVTRTNKGGLSVKEEIEEMDKKIEIDDAGDKFNEGFFPQSYRPALPDHHQHQSNSDQDFFADLGEIEADPLHLLFTTTTTIARGFSGDDDDDDDQRENNNETLDPFSFYDWPGMSGNSSCNNNNNKL